MQFCTRHQRNLIWPGKKSDFLSRFIKSQGSIQIAGGKALESPQPKKKWWPQHHKVGWKTLRNGNEDGESSSTVVFAVAKVRGDSSQILVTRGPQQSLCPLPTTTVVLLLFCRCHSTELTKKRKRCLLLFQNWYTLLLVESLRLNQSFVDLGNKKPRPQPQQLFLKKTLSCWQSSKAIIIKHFDSKKDIEEFSYLRTMSKVRPSTSLTGMGFVLLPPIKWGVEAGMTRLRAEDIIVLSQSANSLSAASASLSSCTTIVGTIKGLKAKSLDSSSSETAAGLTSNSMGLSSGSSAFSLSSASSLSGMVLRLEYAAFLSPEFPETVRRRLWPKGDLGALLAVAARGPVSIARKTGFFSIKIQLWAGIRWTSGSSPTKKITSALTSESSWATFSFLQQKANLYPLLSLIYILHPLIIVKPWPAFEKIPASKFSPHTHYTM